MKGAHFIALLVLLLGMALLVSGRRRKDKSSDTYSDEHHHNKKPPPKPPTTPKPPPPSKRTPRLCKANYCSNPGGIRYYLDPFDPEGRAFCLCSNGIAYRFVCPGNLIFNPKKLRCEWP
jgi:hypothetical protein